MTEIEKQERNANHALIDAIERGGGRAAKRKTAALHHSLRISFESFFLDLLGEDAPAQERPAGAEALPRPERPAEKEAERSAKKSAESPPVTEAAPAGRTEDAPETEAEAPEAPAEEAPRHERAETPAHEAEAKGADEEAGGGDPPKAVERPHEDAKRTEGGVRLRLVEIEAKIRLDRPVTEADVREVVRTLEDLLEDPDVTLEDLQAAIVQIAADLGISRPEATAAVEAAAAEDPADAPGRLRAALDRIIRFLTEKAEGAEPHRAADEVRPEAASEAPASEPKDDPLARLVRKVERAVERLEARAEGEQAKEEPAEGERPAPAPDLPRTERRSERAETRAAGPAPLTNGAEAAAQAAVQAAAPAVGGPEPAALARAARAKAVIQPLLETGQAVEAAARNAGRQEGNHFAFGQYHRNESQRARPTPESRPVPYRTPVEEDVFREVIRRAKVVIENGRSEATIELKPEFLGRLKLNVVVEGGRTAVTFQAENAVVRGMLEANLEALRRSLSEHGLEVELLEVAAGHAGFGEAAPRDEDETDGGSPYGGGASDGDDAGDLDDVEADPAVAAEALRNEARRSHVSYVA